MGFARNVRFCDLDLIFKVIVRLKLLNLRVLGSCLSFVDKFYPCPAEH